VTGRTLTCVIEDKKHSPLFIGHYYFDLTINNTKTLHSITTTSQFLSNSIGKPTGHISNLTFGIHKRHKAFRISEVDLYEWKGIKIYLTIAGCFTTCILCIIEQEMSK
jgi:hypothetical protein